MRWMHLRLSDFAIDRPLRLDADAASRTLALSAPDRGRDMLVAVSPAAAVFGVRRGQTASAGRALCAQLEVRPHDPEADHEALRALATQMFRCSPDVALDPRLEGAQRGLFVEIGRTQSLFGGEVATLHGASKLAERLGYRNHVAVSDVPAAARALTWSRPQQISRVESGALEPVLKGLPWPALELSREPARALDALGVETLADLAALPSSGLRARFGDEVCEALERIFGRAEEDLPRHRAPKIFRERLEWWPPRSDLAPILFAAKRLFDAAENHLLTRDEALVEARLTIGLSERGKRLPLRLRPAAPATRAETLLRLLQTRLESFELPAAAENLEIVFVETTPLRAEQGDLFEAPRRAWSQETFELLDRLRGRLGEHRVLRAELRADARPEHAFAWRPADGNTVSKTRNTTPATRPTRRPLTLESPPRPLGLTIDAAGRPRTLERGPWRGPVRCASGPELVEGGWWEGRPARRRYFEIETGNGAHLWVFHDLVEDRWFLHGRFD